jgi:hypothetical protein
MLTAIIAIIAAIIDIDITAIIDALAPAAAAATLAPAAWLRITREIAEIRRASEIAAANFDCAENLILADEYEALMIEIEDAGETRATVTAPALLHPMPQHYLGALNPHYDA